MNIQNHPIESCIQLEKEAVDFGFKWRDVLSAVDQASSECQEIKEAIEKEHSPSHLQEEIGDLLQAAIGVCLVCNFDVNETLKKANDKFAKRITKVKELTYAQGLHNLHGQSFAFKMDLWKKAKNI